jgi:hypothetical protein
MCAGFQLVRLDCAGALRMHWAALIIDPWKVMNRIVLMSVVCRYGIKMFGARARQAEWGEVYHQMPLTVIALWNVKVKSESEIQMQMQL